MTLVSDLTKSLDTASELRDGHRGADAGREFALAATAIEDAIMRVNRGFAHANDTFKVADVEADNAA